MNIPIPTLLGIVLGIYGAYRIYQTEQLAKAVIDMTQPSSVSTSAAAVPSSELFGSEIYNVY
jgi:hypothetical protein